MYTAIDADYLVYSCGFAANDDPLEHALHNVKRKLNSYIDDITTMFGVCDYEVFISSKNNFRDQITPTYKANRSNNTKPIHYDDIRTYMLDVWGATMVDGIEADDAVAIEHYKRWCVDTSSTIIAACDKDLWTVPGWHYNTFKGKYTFEYIDMYTADYNLYTQMLTGDTVDNIQGIKGIGPKKAEKLLQPATNVSDLEEIVKNSYKEAFEDDWENQYNINYKLLYILREAGDE